MHSSPDGTAIGGKNRNKTAMVPNIMLLFSHSVVSDSLQPQGLQHIRLPRPSPSPRVYDAIQPSPPVLNLSQHQSLFQWVGFSHQVVKVLKLQHQFYEYSGLVFSRIDWFYLLGVQGTLKRLLQHHSLTASILQHSAFFIVQLPCPYMTTGKTITDYYRPLSAKWCLCAFLS